jgi:hypothetical protein
LDASQSVIVKVGLAAHVSADMVGILVGAVAARRRTELADLR